MKTTTIGVFKNSVDASAAISELKSLGISDKDISYVSHQGEKNYGSGTKAAHSATGAVSGATTGAIIGGIAGLAVANGILPGLGTLFVAGPLAAALGFTGAVATTAAGALTGAAAGGLVGALAGLGIKDSDAQMYEEMVRQGNLLVIAHSNTPGVATVFEKYNAEEIREYENN